jgi:hypothetical protein
LPKVGKEESQCTLTKTTNKKVDAHQQMSTKRKSMRINKNKRQKDKKDSIPGNCGGELEMRESE